MNHKGREAFEDCTARALKFDHELNYIRTEHSFLGLVPIFPSIFLLLITETLIFFPSV